MWANEEEEGLNESPPEEKEEPVVARKAPPKAGNDNAAFGGGAPEQSGQKSTPIVAIVAVVLAFIAFCFSIYTTLLWWDWPWVITTPALVLAIVAIAIAYAMPGHDEAVLCCGIIGIILALASTLWCITEISMCYSYQGPLTEFSAEKLAAFHAGLANTRLTETDTEMALARFYRSHGVLCKGRCFDWFYKSSVISKKMACKQKVEKHYRDKYLQNGKKISYCTSTRYEGVDSYAQSPIFLTHADIAENNKMFYSTDSGAAFSENTLNKNRDSMCDEFDVSKYDSERDKCDKAYEKFDPQCLPEWGGMVFNKKVSDDDARRIDEEACKYGAGKYRELGVHRKPDTLPIFDALKSADCLPGLEFHGGGNHHVEVEFHNNYD